LLNRGKKSNIYIDIQYIINYIYALLYMACPRAVSIKQRKTVHMMYKRRLRNPQQTALIFDFPSSFLDGITLQRDNQWVALASRIPWEVFEPEYVAQFGLNGNDAMPFRVALGSLLIKERLQLSDRETVQQIRENPYLQYFLGVEEYSAEAPFDPSLMTHFRKRISEEMLSRINEAMVMAERARGKVTPTPEKSDGDGESGGGDSSSPAGVLIIDATCAPEDMRYPTDLGLLNEAREVTERVIDRLWESLPTHARAGTRKPRTYRRKARGAYLSTVRLKKPKSEKLREACGKQLTYLNRNQSTIVSLCSRGASLDVLDAALRRKLEVVAEVVRQQTEMLPSIGKPGHRIDNRIVSLSKPHVRPIVRGKASAPVEFGAKLSASVIDGYFFVDRISWDAYNECGDLSMQAERYRERMGRYPAAILADKIYRTKANRAWCTERGIRLAGLAQGRPFADEARNRAARKQLRQDDRDRSEIEGKIGVGKRRYSLDLLMTKLRETSETTIGVIVLAINCGKILRDLFLSFLTGGFSVVFGVLRRSFLLPFTLLFDTATVPRKLVA
jgi:hypothetical protein